MDNDDRQIGRLLSRREAVALLGASGAALLASCRRPDIVREESGVVLPSCVVRPEQTLGPYFVEERLNRSDIRSDPSNGKLMAGALLALSFTVSRVGASSCTPLPGAQVDVWQCDADGIYSDVTDPRFNTVGQKFLRGHQLTNPAGFAGFTTIYPGWYQGRTVHIHFKVRTTPAAAQGYQFVSQLYFDDAFTDRVFASAPYASRAKRSTRNDQDGIFRRGGAQLMLDVKQSGDRYAASFDIGLQI
jgi:protocatechuate 3,4-dioxygenase beta subunit